MVKEQRRWDFRKYSFSQRTVNQCNQLSADCVHSSSMFKNRIDNDLEGQDTLRFIQVDSR